MAIKNFRSYIANTYFRNLLNITNNADVHVVNKLEENKLWKRFDVTSRSSFSISHYRLTFPLVSWVADSYYVLRSKHQVRLCLRSYCPHRDEGRQLQYVYTVDGCILHHVNAHINIVFLAYIVCQRSLIRWLTFHLCTHLSVKFTCSCR